MIIVSTYPLKENVMASVRMRHLLKFLAQQNRQVTYVCPESDKTKWSFVIEAAKAIAKQVKRNPEEIVVASIPGIQSLMATVLARFLARSHFQLVLEVRDPFSLNPALPWSGFKRAAGRILERALLRAPNRIVFLTSAIQSIYVNGFPGKQAWKSNYTVITNGYEPFTGNSTSENEGSPVLTLTYAGHFYDRRNPLAFLSALRDYLRSQSQALPVKVQMAGEIHGEDLKQRVTLISDDPFLQNCVQWLGLIPYDQSQRLMRNSDINLLITHDQGSEYAIPGKLFEYMGAKRPVLAVTRDPLVSQLMRETHLGWICEDQASLMQWFALHLNDRDAIRRWEPNEKNISAYQLENIHPRWLRFIEGSGS